MINMSGGLARNMFDVAHIRPLILVARAWPAHIEFFSKFVVQVRNFNVPVWAGLAGRPAREQL